MAQSLFRMAAVLGLLAAAGPLAIDAYLPALPAITQDLGTIVAATQATLTFYFAAFGLAQLVYGPWADAAGRKRPLYWGLALFALGSLGCAVAPSIEVLIAARIVQGAGAATVMVVPRAIIRDLHTGPAAARLMAMIMLVISISPMLAPLLGSAIIAIGSWRLIFWALLAAVALSLVLTHFALPETLPPERRERPSGRRMWHGAGRLFRDRTFLGLTLVGGFGMASFFVFIANASFVYTGAFGLSPTGFSIAFAINALGFFAASQMAGPLGERIGLDRLILIGTAGFAAVTAALLAIAVAGDVSLVTMVAMLFVGNAFLGVVIPSSMVMALDDQGDIAGLASSLGGTLQMLAGAAMITLAAPWFDGTPLPLIAAIAVCGLLSLAATQLVPAMRRRRALA